jgi:hypothetical protein
MERWNSAKWVGDRKLLANSDCCEVLNFPILGTVLVGCAEGLG